MDELTPRQIVAELNRYIIGQEQAKRMVAIALRNRARRRKLPPELRDEVSPKNIIMIGPTGVGKTEIARRLARLANAPMVKVEATKYTEVGYVGRDVESMVRDLVENAISLVRTEKSNEVLEKAEKIAEERILDALLPPPPGVTRQTRVVDGKPESFYDIPEPVAGEELTREQQWLRTREKMRELLRQKKLEDREIEIEIKHTPEVQVLGPLGGMSGSFDDLGGEFRNMFEKLFPPREKRTRVRVSEAREIYTQQAIDSLIDMDKISREALERAEESGIIFIDEIDKIAGRSSGHGPDVSREGVQRDILPIVEGCVVNTKYGPVRTDHILFIAAGAFHMSKPSDLIPELQGRFPLRCELGPLGMEEFKRILREPQNALTRQYKALLETEGVELEFTEDGIDEIARAAAFVNEQAENIGARRLHTVMEKVLEDVLFEAGEPDCPKKVVIDSGYVKTRLQDILKNQDLSRFIL